MGRLGWGGRAAGVCWLVCWWGLCVRESWGSGAMVKRQAVILFQAVAGKEELAHLQSGPAGQDTLRQAGKGVPHAASPATGPVTEPARSQPPRPGLWARW